MTALIDHLIANTASFSVIAEAPSSETISTVDATAASIALKTLLEAAVSNAYALNAPENMSQPDAVYTLVSAQAVAVGGIRIGTEVTFVVTIRDTSYSGLMTQLAAVETQVLAAAEQISISDASANYDEKPQLFLIALEVQYMVPAISGSPQYPQLLVNLDSAQASASLYDNVTKQRITRTHSLLIMAQSNTLVTLRTEVQEALLGWQETSLFFEMEYQNGAAIAMPGGLYAWREVYADGYMITET